MGDLFSDAKHAFTEVTSGAYTAPTPKVGSSPPAPARPRTWTAPTVKDSGHIEVHHGALIDAAETIRKYVPELEAALKRVSSHSGAFESLMSWATGAAFGGNLSAAVSAFGSAGKQTSEAHLIHAKNAQDCAETYGGAETQSTQGIKAIDIGAPGAASPVPGGAATLHAPLASGPPAGGSRSASHGTTWG